ncbi:unnamed protein product [Arctogadus glacialis]
MYMIDSPACPGTDSHTKWVPGVFPESPCWLLLAGRSEDTSSFSGRRGSSRENRDDESLTELDLEPRGCSRLRLSYHELFHSRNIWKNICILRPHSQSFRDCEDPQTQAAPSNLTLSSPAEHREG